eukprot:1160602-Pelagomonas_calceolata.AAC.10
MVGTCKCNHKGKHTKLNTISLQKGNHDGHAEGQSRWAGTRAIMMGRHKGNHNGQAQGQPWWAWRRPSRQQHNANLSLLAGRIGSLVTLSSKGHLLASLQCSFMHHIARDVVRICDALEPPLSVPFCTACTSFKHQDAPPLSFLSVNPRGAIRGELATDQAWFATSSCMQSSCRLCATQGMWAIRNDLATDQAWFATSNCIRCSCRLCVTQGMWAIRNDLATDQAWFATSN